MPFDGTKFETIAGQMRDLFKSGSKWGKEVLYGQGHYCLLGAFIAVTKNVRGYGVEEWADDYERLPHYAKLRRACATVAGDDAEDEYTEVPEVNDAIETKYQTIEEVLDEMERLEIAGQMKKLKIQTIAKAMPLKKKALVTA